MSPVAPDAVVRQAGVCAFGQDNGAEFTAANAMCRMRDQTIDPGFIRPGIPWQTGVRGGGRDQRHPSLR